MAKIFLNDYVKKYTTLQCMTQDISCLAPLYMASNLHNLCYGTPSFPWVINIQISDPLCKNWLLCLKEESIHTRSRYIKAAMLTLLIDLEYEVSVCALVSNWLINQSAVDRHKKFDTVWSLKKKLSKHSKTVSVVMVFYVHVNIVNYYIELISSGMAQETISYNRPSKSGLTNYMTLGFVQMDSNQNTLSVTLPLKSQATFWEKYNRPQM